MKTKREVLVAICESPGWQPPEESSSIDRFLHELQREGWVIPRLDGFEATPQALDAYPRFESQKDIRSLSAGIVMPETGEAPDPVPGVPEPRVVALLVAMLHELPLARVSAMVAVRPSNLPPDKVTWDIARRLVERMK